MAYGIKYYISYKTTDGKDGVVYIYRRNYSGAQTELSGTSSPIKDSAKGADDELESPIKAKNWTITIFDIAVGTYDEFFTSDSRMFLIIVKENAVEVARGWVDVDSYSRPLFTHREDLIITVNDGMAGLKNEEWRDINGNAFEGYVTLKDAICACLYRTNFEIGLYESCDIYAAGMDEGDGDSMFTQAKFRADVFKKSDGTFESCYDVLSEILRRFQCEIYQNLGHWHLTRINNRIDSFVRRYYYHNAGQYTYSSYDTYDPTIEIDGVTSWFWDMPIITPKPAWKKFILEQDYGFDANIGRVSINDLREFQLDWAFVSIEDKYTKFGTYGGIQYSVYDSGIIRLYHSYTFNASRYLQVLVYIEDNTNQRLKISLAFGGNAPITIRAFYLYYYQQYGLDSNGEWFLNDISKNIFKNNADVSFEPIYVNEFPGNGWFMLRFYQPYAPTRNRYDDFIINPKDIKLELESLIGFDESYTETTIINENNFYVPDTLELKLGDIPDISNANNLYKGGLYLDDGITHTSLWHTLDDPTNEKTLNGLLSDEISENHIYSSNVINCIISGDIEIGNTIIVDGLIFLITRISSHDRYEQEMECDITQIGITEEKQAYLKLKAGGYIRLKTGGKIKIRKK